MSEPKTKASINLSIERYRQGVSVNDFRQIFGSTLPHLYGGNSFSLAISGSSVVSRSSFNDSASGISKERLSTGNTSALNYQVIVSHFKEPGEYGLNNPGFDPDVPFSEKLYQSSGSNASILFTQDAITNVPTALQFKALSSYGHTDSIIEPFPIRKIIDSAASSLFAANKINNTVMQPLKAKGINGDICIMHSDNNKITNYQLQNPNANKPFDESYVSKHELTAESTKNEPTSNMKPFDDMSANGNIGRLGFVYSSNGFNATFDSTFNSVIQAMSPNSGSGFYDNEIMSTSTGAGYTYAVPSLSGFRMGTDSLAFGGLKK